MRIRADSWRVCPFFTLTGSRLGIPAFFIYRQDGTNELSYINLYGISGDTASNDKSDQIIRVRCSLMSAVAPQRSMGTFSSGITVNFLQNYLLPLHFLYFLPETGQIPAELSSSAALLIFLTASARTRIVRVDFSCRCRLHRHCCRHKAVRHCSVRLACGKRPYCS